MKNFHNISLPSFISIHAKGSPVFATQVATTASGREARFADRMHSMQKYTISNCRLGSFQFDEFNGFFRARKGRQHSFRMRDYADCIIFDQVIGESVADLSVEVFKTYPDNLKPYARRITKLVMGSVQLQLEGLDLRPANIDYEQGIIILDQPLHKGQHLMINATFDVEVRFASDDFKYSMHQDGSIMIDDLEIVEVV